MDGDFARLSNLIRRNVYAWLMDWQQVETSANETEFIVLWRRGEEYGTHRAVLARHSNDAMLVWGHYGLSHERALRDYNQRVGS